MGNSFRSLHWWSSSYVEFTIRLSKTS